MKINKSKRSPNYSSRKGQPIQAILLHHTGGSYPSDLNWLCHPDSGVSVHYYIRRDGEIFQLVDDEHKAWHAGRGAFDLDADGHISKAEMNLNARTIGIELESKGDSYTEEQLKSLDELVEYLMNKYSIHPYDILGHKEIAPNRKWDPGNFDMDAYREKMSEKWVESKINDYEVKFIKLSDLMS